MKKIIMLGLSALVIYSGAIAQDQMSNKKSGKKYSNQDSTGMNGNMNNGGYRGADKKNKSSKNMDMNHDNHTPNNHNGVGRTDSTNK